MSFKKFAMLILTVVMISGFYTKPVSASANEDVSTAPVVEEIVTEAEDVSEESVTEKVTDAAEEIVFDEKTEDTDEEAVEEETTASTGKSTATAKGSGVKASEKAKYTKNELRLMASIINCEAGGESFQGKLAVGIVVMNRVESKLFPNTIKKVIFQKNQFSPVRNGMLNKMLKQYDAGKTNSAQWKSCISAAKKVLNGQRTIIYKGKVKSLKGYHFFSAILPGARIKLGGHSFK